MGDGRYYTFRQFFQIFYLTGMSALVMFTILFMALRSRIKEGVQFIVRSLWIFLVLLIIGFIKEVTYEMDAFVIMTYMCLFLVLLQFAIWIEHYIRKGLITYICLGIFIVLVGTDFTEAIGFMEIEFSTNYKIIITSFQVLLLVLVFREVLHKYPGKSSFYTSILRYSFLKHLLMGVGIVIVTGTYLVHVYFETIVPIHQLGLLIAIFIVLYVFVRLMPEEKIPAGYRELVESMVDTIIMLNHNKEVLDVNSTYLSQYIKSGKVQLDLPESFIALPILSSIQLLDHVTEVVLKNGDSNITIHYSYTEILKKDKCIGYVIVIEDYTMHEEMLHQLEIKKNELEEMKKDLLRYSRTSKMLSAEKERHRLLIEVQNDLGHQLAELSKYILSTSDKVEQVNDNNIQDLHEIKEAIKHGVYMAKSNLANIRETVRLYRSSYEDGK